MDEKLITALLQLSQTIAWIVLIVWLLLKFRVQLENLTLLISTRIASGDKLTTPWLTLEGVPETIKTKRRAVTTTEGVAGSEISHDLYEFLRKKQYPAGIVEHLYLVHEAQVIRQRTGRQNGLYRVRIWVEAYDKRIIAEVTRVSYRLYNDDFEEPVIATTAKENNFELWLNVYGEFNVVAYVERKNGEQHSLWLTRYLDLPGRPPE